MIQTPLASLHGPLAATALSLLLLTACTATPTQAPAAAVEPAAQGAAQAAAEAAEASAAQAPVVPTLTVAQREQLDAALDLRISHAFLRQAMAEAKPTLTEFLSRNACLANDDGSALNDLAAQGVSFPATGYATPMAALPSHDVSRCVGVSALQKISALTLRHLRLDAVYQASSGELHTQRHELQKQADGQWRMLR